MKIKVTHNTERVDIPAWFGKMGEDGFLYRNGKIDLKQGMKRYNYFWELRNKGGK